eukprot:Sspe_Gene.37256::Locus_17975_Transcript_1_1_Confidence_1.000_Length_602::g.37256::m.37256
MYQLEASNPWETYNRALTCLLSGDVDKAQVLAQRLSGGTHRDLIEEIKTAAAKGYHSLRWVVADVGMAVETVRVDTPSSLPPHTIPLSSPLQRSALPTGS